MPFCATTYYYECMGFTNDLGTLYRASHDAHEIDNIDQHWSGRKLYIFVETFTGQHSASSFPQADIFERKSMSSIDIGRQVNSDVKSGHHIRLQVARNDKSWIGFVYAVCSHQSPTLKIISRGRTDRRTNWRISAFICRSYEIGIDRSS